MYEKIFEGLKQIAKPIPSIILDKTTKKELKSVISEMKVHSRVIDSIKQVANVKSLSLDEQQLKLLREQISQHTDEIVKYAQEISRILGF